MHSFAEINPEKLHTTFIEMYTNIKLQQLLKLVKFKQRINIFKKLQKSLNPLIK